MPCHSPCRRSARDDQTVPPLIVPRERRPAGEFVPPAGRRFAESLCPHQGIGGLTPADRFFEIETTVKRQLAGKIADNTLELALQGHVRKPFMMVGRVGDSCVSILEKKRQFAVLAGKSAWKRREEEFSHCYPEAKNTSGFFVTAADCIDRRLISAFTPSSGRFRRFRIAFP